MSAPDGAALIASDDAPESTSVARCEQETYLEWGYPDADYEVHPAIPGPFVVAFVCDGFGLKDCGWRQEHERGDLTGGITYSEMVSVHAAHMAGEQRG